MSEVRLRHLNLNLLVVLHTVLECEGVSRAARQLNRTQSAVSHHLATLRTHFGDPLLVSRGRSMVRTPLGDALLEETATAIRAVDRVFADREPFEPMTSTRLFRVSASISAAWLPGLLGMLAEEAPRVRIRVVPPPRAALSGMLADEVSVAFAVAAARSEANLYRRLLPEEPFLTVLGRPLSQSLKALDLETFCRLDHVLLAPYGGEHGVVDEQLATLGRARTVLVAVSDFSAIGPMLDKLSCIATLPARAARWLAATYALEVFPPPLSLPAMRPALVWHARVHQAPAEVWFREVLWRALEPSA